MQDTHGREITYLRISVTDKCNLRCTYCMPTEGVPIRRHDELLSFERIADIVRSAVGLGITKIRFTGGEPLVKRGIVNLVRLVRAVDDRLYLGMTTNGTLLSRYAAPLRTAGLDSVNVSLDTLDRERYAQITRGGDLASTLAGIDATLHEGIPVKINMVVLEDTAGEEIEAMRSFCAAKRLDIQLIRQYRLDEEKADDTVYDRPPRCEGCNRIRLLADGVLKPCLHSDAEFAVDPADIEASLRAAVQGKPARGSACTKRCITQIGG